MSVYSVAVISKLGALVAFVLFPVVAFGATLPLGIFEGHQDVGTVLHPGSIQYDGPHNSYTVSGSGANMWSGMDDFQFVWKKVSGDVALTGNIAFVGIGREAHRKAVLMIRQTLDGNSAAADVAVHGNGMTALQYRDALGANMHGIQLNVTSPRTMRIVKRGDYVYAFVSDNNGKLEPAGAATKLGLTGSFYVGIGICAHNKDVVESAVFSDVSLKQLKPAKGKQTELSVLETISVLSGDRQVEYLEAAHFEAPNWSHDGSSLIFNQDHAIRRFALGGSSSTIINTAPQNHCNDDHGFSPDGQMLGISDRSADDGKSHVFVVPLTGGTPRQITKNGPSYWHSWSPDGKTIAFTGERAGNVDVYSISAKGGDETRLTTSLGVDDGAEYSPDGVYIYFNSARAGQMQIWRMKADGSEQQQVISDDRNDWFPHISPDGQWMVFVSYDQGVTGHPAEKDVELRLVSINNKTVRVLAKLFGGQGTMNSPSWSPDSRKLAFVSYELLPDEGVSLK